jgi:hypothetical protein
MVNTPPIPYVAYEYFPPDARRLTIGLHGLTASDYLRIKFIRLIRFQDRDDGQHITFDHVTGVFAVHGRNLQDSVCNNLEDVRNL